MIVYLDVSCLNRPFDNQGQARIRIEAEALTVIFKQIEEGHLHAVSSQMAEIEIDAIADPERRQNVRAFLPSVDDIIVLRSPVYSRAEMLVTKGFRPADAVHVAAAESAGAHVLLTCDDRLYRVGRRHRSSLSTRVMNIVDFVQEYLDASDT